MESCSKNIMGAISNRARRADRKEENELPAQCAFSRMSCVVVRVLKIDRELSEESNSELVEP